ncbi:hypothetical protein KIN20_004556 [Parelaphostrongylus tenuis]|uniref:Cytidyltransferase-like domain-containing protein n=1 Tax=Parelaphostrongylus tenuis TaxID=148309 RepID=A0AAD5QF85_PARTN|nr:hypothetical protein KIN20_004556 [Parelaphostrongylus tenuis]
MVSDPGTSLSGCRVALLSCGQFDPPSYAHLRMFERARDFLVRTMGCKVVEGIMSVGQDTATTHTPAKHRLRMVETVVRKNFWIRAGDFECKQRSSVKQLAVLKHYQEQLSHKHGESIRVMYVCGSEVLEDLAAVQPKNPYSWNHSEIKELLQKHGLIVLKRGRTRPSHTIYLTDVLRQYQKYIYVIEDETFPNDLRCSRIRTAVRRGESVKYCLDDDVIDYINEHSLYKTSSYDCEQCDQSMSIVSTPTVMCSDSSTMRINGDEPDMPPEPPQRSCSERVRNIPMINRILSPEGHAKPSAYSSSGSCTSSIESSEPQLVSQDSPLTQIPPPSNRHAVICADTQTEPVPSPSEYEADEMKCNALAPKIITDHTTNQMTVTSSAKEKISATITLPSKDSQQASEFLKGNCIDKISGKLPSSTFIEPTLKKAEPAADSQSVNTKSSDCDAVPHCMVSSVTLDVEKKLGGRTGSPSYDNVTLDDLLVATTSWADYLQGENERNGGLKNESCKELVASSDPQSSSTLSTGGKERRRSWFFNNNKSVKVVEPPEQAEPLMRISATDRRPQKQKPSEILWRKISPSKSKERCSEIPPPSRSPPHCLRHPEQFTAKVRNDSKIATFRLPNPSESMQSNRITRFYIAKQR